MTTQALDTTVMTFRNLQFTVKTYADGDTAAPWLEHDGHGIVSEYFTYDDPRGAEYRANDARYREMPCDRSGARYYDLTASHDKAVKEGWGLSPDKEAALIVSLGRALEPADVITAAIDADYQYCADWSDGTWQWIGIVVSSIDMPSVSESLWGLASNDGAYLQSVARDLADEVIGRLPSEVQTMQAELTTLRDRLLTTAPAEKIDISALAETWINGNRSTVFDTLRSQADPLAGAALALHLSEALRGQYGQAAVLEYNYAVRKMGGAL